MDEYKGKYGISKNTSKKRGKKIKTRGEQKIKNGKRNLSTISI